jgi:hypothetical protein
MATSSKDQRLLSSFPRPPPGPPTPSPRRPTAPSPRPSDFGFIHVALDDDTREKTPSYRDQDAGADKVVLVLPRRALHQTSTTHDTTLGKLQLVLDSPQKLFSPGETITGFMSGWDPGFHIHIILEGCAKVVIATEDIHSHSHAQYKTGVLLLYHTTYLRPEPRNVVPRFTITIPEKTENERDKLKYLPSDSSFSSDYWPYDWPRQNTFEHDAGHPLPPSILAFNESHTDFTTRSRGRATVEYKLIAVRSQLDPNAQKLIPNASCEAPIHLTTRRLAP